MEINFKSYEYNYFDIMKTLKIIINNNNNNIAIMSLC